MTPLTKRNFSFDYMGQNTLQPSILRKRGKKSQRTQMAPSPLAIEELNSSKIVPSPLIKGLVQLVSI